TRVMDIGLVRDVCDAMHVVRPVDGDDIGDGTGRQTVESRRSLAERDAGCLVGDRPDSGECGTGKAGSADDGDELRSTFGIDEFDAGVGIGHQGDVRNVPPGAVQTLLIRRSLPDTAHAAARASVEAQYIRRYEGRLSGISARGVVGDAGQVVAPTRLHLDGVIFVEEQAGAADGGGVGGGRRHGNGGRAVGGQEVAVVAARVVDRDAERGTRLVDVVVDDEFLRVAGYQRDLWLAIAIGNHITEQVID